MKIAVATEELTGATHEAIESLVAQLQGTEIPPFAIGPASFSFIPTANNGSVPFNCSGSACTYALVGKLAIAFYTIQFDADTENPTEIYVPLPKKAGSVPTRIARSIKPSLVISSVLSVSSNSMMASSIFPLIVRPLTSFGAPKRRLS